jgi:DNA-binding CsgD family transcriptional regulator
MRGQSSTCERYALDLAHCAREVADSRTFRAFALAALSELIGSDSAIFVEPASEPPFVTTGIDDRALAVIEYCERNLPRYSHEVAKALTEAHRTGGVIDRDVFSSDERSRSAFYGEIVQAQGIDSMLILVPRWRGRVLGMLRLQRAARPAFRADDLTLAKRLLPSIEVGLVALQGAPLRRSSELPMLSHREVEVARHVARGLTTPQIALLLGTSKLTVRNQIGRIFDKVRVASRAELASWVARHDAREGD